MNLSSNQVSTDFINFENSTQEEEVQSTIVLSANTDDALIEGLELELSNSPIDDIANVTSSENISSVEVDEESHHLDSLIELDTSEYDESITASVESVTTVESGNYAPPTYDEVIDLDSVALVSNYRTL